MDHLLIRQAEAADLPALLDIFNHYVLNGHATFATAPHSLDSRRAWFEGYSHAPYRLLVGELGGAVAGCAYASRYRPGSAFDATVETSIYLHPGRRGAGLGRQLYGALLDHLARQPVHLAVAAVALPNPASLALHRRMGFEEVGTFREYAHKNGEWISSTWFQRPVGTAVRPPAAATS